MKTNIWSNFENFIINFFGDTFQVHLFQFQNGLEWFIMLYRIDVAEIKKIDDGKKFWLLIVINGNYVTV